MTARRLALAALILTAAALGFLVGRFVTRVPSAATTYAETAERLLAAGLRVRNQGASAPAAQSEVIALSPPGGSFIIKGMPVTVQVRVDDGHVAVPDLLGLPALDADERIRAAGFAAADDLPVGTSASVTQRMDGPYFTVDLPLADATSPGSFADLMDLSIVITQTPPPGAMAALGTVVHYTARFPHGPEAPRTDPDVARLHGLTYLRSGVEGLPACSNKMCHSASTCIGRDCHAGASYDQLAQTAPNE